MSRSIKELRAELDVLDEEMIALVARRMAIVGEIGSRKAEEGLPVFDREREREVLDGAAARAVRAGLEASVGEGLMHTLIEASHRAQEAKVRAVSEVARHVVIVGGGGLMGRLFEGALSGRGHRVSILDRGDALDRTLIGSADVVMLSVPMGLAAEIAREVAPMVRADALLCDINSLKGEVCGVFREVGVSEALGTHPMFGPTVETLRRQKVVVCPVRSGPATEHFLGELRDLGLELIEAEPDEHDKMMAVVQVLVHFRTLVMGEALRRSGVSLRRSLEFTSPIYRLELAVVGRLFDQDPNLYAEIEMQNPYGDAMREVFLGASETMAGLVASGDRERFAEAFESVRAYFDGFTGEAMALSDYVIEALVSRA